VDFILAKANSGKQRNRISANFRTQGCWK